MPFTTGVCCRLCWTLLSAHVFYSFFCRPERSKFKPFEMLTGVTFQDLIYCSHFYHLSWLVLVQQQQFVFFIHICCETTCSTCEGELGMPRHLLFQYLTRLELPDLWKTYRIKHFSVFFFLTDAHLANTNHSDRVMLTNVNNAQGVHLSKVATLSR